MAKERTGGAIPPEGEIPAGEEPKPADWGPDLEVTWKAQAEAFKASTGFTLPAGSKGPGVVQETSQAKGKANGNGGSKRPPTDVATAQAGEPGKPARKKVREMTLAEFVETQEAKSRIIQALPKAMNVDRWKSVIIALANSDPKLARCTPVSIVAAALQGATLGLDFNKTLGEAFLIPRKAGEVTLPSGLVVQIYEASFMPGYRGLRKLVMNGGEVVKIECRLVYESEALGINGKFAYRFTPELEFLHEPCIDPRERGEIALAYMVAKLRSGEYVVEVMTRGEIEESAHKRAAYYNPDPSKEDGPWRTDYGEMCRKTVLKRGSKSLPMTPEAQQAFDLDNAHYSVSHPSAPALPRNYRQRVSGMQALNERLGIGQSESPAIPPENSLDSGAILGDNEDRVSTTSATEV